MNYKSKTVPLSYISFRTWHTLHIPTEAFWQEPYGPTIDRYIDRVSTDYRLSVDRYIADRSVDTTYSKHDPATLTHYIFITFLINTYIALMHQLSWMLLRGECCASEPDFFSKFNLQTVSSVIVFQYVRLIVFSIFVCVVTTLFGVPVFTVSVSSWCFSFFVIHVLKKWTLLRDIWNAWQFSPYPFLNLNRRNPFSLYKGLVIIYREVGAGAM